MNLLSSLSSLLSALFSLRLLSLSLSVSVSLFVKCCGRVVVVCCVKLCLVWWCGGCACGVWCDTPKKTRVFVRNVSVCTGTTRTCVFNMCAWCRQTRRRIERIHTVECGVDTREGGRGGDGTHVENGASSTIERAALARCNVLIIRNRNTLQTICSATFAPFLCCSFFFFPSSYDDAMRGTTTQGQRPPRQRQVDNTTPHPTTQPTTTRDTRHDTAPHNKKTKTHTYTHMYMSMSLILLMSHEKKSGLEYVPSMMCTVPNPLIHNTT